MKDPIEYLGFDDEEEVKRKVGRPKLADKAQKKRSLIVAGFSFIAVAVLLVFGYGTLFGFKTINLRGTAMIKPQNNGEKIIISDIKPIFKNITLKAGTARKLYVRISPVDATNKELSYSSSDEKVLAVDETGKVTALKEGNSVVTVSTKDGSNKSTKFYVSVVRNADGECSFSRLSKTNSGVNYQVECSNANIKNIYYKIGNEKYSKLLTKKPYDSVRLSEEQKNKLVTFKVVYYANNSNVTKYSTRTIKPTVSTTTKINGGCSLNIVNVSVDSAKYKINCTNSSVTNIAYKIGNGSYVGLDKSNLADTVIFEDSDVTRIIYFKVEYKVDGTSQINSITKTSVVQKSVTKTTTTVPTTTAKR